MRRLFAHFDLQVSRLIRLRFGRYELPRDLPLGKWREVTIDENATMSALLSPSDAPAATDKKLRYKAPKVRSTKAPKTRTNKAHKPRPTHAAKATKAHKSRKPLAHKPRTTKATKADKPRTTKAPKRA